MRASRKIKNIAKYANFSNNGLRQMEFSMFGGGEDGEYNGVGFEEISKIFAMQGTFLFGTAPFDS